MVLKVDAACVRRMKGVRAQALEFIGTAASFLDMQKALNQKQKALLKLSRFFAYELWFMNHHAEEMLVGLIHDRALLAMPTEERTTMKISEVV